MHANQTIIIYVNSEGEGVKGHYQIGNVHKYNP